MIRPGHHRPLGTTTWMRFPEWGCENQPPELGDVAIQVSGPGAEDSHLYERAYRVAGIVEGTKPRSYRLLMERIVWDDRFDIPDHADSASGLWVFYNVPRS